MIIMAEKSLSTSEKKDIIEEIIVTVGKYYLFPEIAKKIKNSLLKNIENNIYDAITDYSMLASILTKNLQDISKDNHFYVEFAPENIKNGKILSDIDNLPPEEKVKESLKLQKIYHYVDSCFNYETKIPYIYL